MTVPRDRPGSFPCHALRAVHACGLAAFALCSRLDPGTTVAPPWTLSSSFCGCPLLRCKGTVVFCREGRGRASSSRNWHPLPAKRMERAPPYWSRCCEMGVSVDLLKPTSARSGTSAKSVPLPVAACSRVRWTKKRNSKTDASSDRLVVYICDGPA